MAALKSQGGASPSGLDSQGWRRLRTSFRKASSDLCNSVELLARRICTTTVDPVGLAPLTACRLVTLDKCPRVLLVGIGETIRRIIAKAILHIIGPEIQQQDPLSCVLARSLVVRLQFMLCVRYLMTKTLKRFYK